MNLIYKIGDRPAFRQVIVFAIQQLLAIMAATLVVPVITNGNWGVSGPDALSPAAALFGAGAGTIIYLLFTKFSSPVFLGSSFAFLGSMASAFAGSIAVSYLGLVLGAVFAGLVYVVLAIVLQIVKAFEKASKRSVPYVIKPRRPGDIGECWADPALALKELGWKAERGIEEMCEDAWRWQRKNPYGYNPPKKG